MGLILTIVFTVLKAVDVIHFSWLYVFLPIIIEVGLKLLAPVWYFLARWATSEDD